MNRHGTRREFLAASAAAGMGLLAAGRLDATPFKTKLYKAMTAVGKPTEGLLKKLKAAGFDGMEAPHNLTPDEARTARQTAEKLGLRIHSVLRGWMKFNDPSKVDADVADVAQTLKIAQILGSDTILVVPCRIDAYTAGKTPKGVLMPEAWEFDIEFDEKTGHVHRVVRGDNAPYQPYIEAQNRATDMSRAAVRRLIPAAEKTGVIVALENVWNNLWVKPAWRRTSSPRSTIPGSSPISTSAIT